MPPARRQKTVAIQIPPNANDVELDVGGKPVKLTNLEKLFWADEKITKRDLLQYYADVSPVLLPHLKNRAMVMKRYPHGASGEFFFMKRTPNPHPDWLETCPILHKSGNLIHFPIVQDLASLLWVVNLGCIDLNQWYAICDDVDRPDYLHFDLDPVPGATWQQVCETALKVRDELAKRRIACYPKTTGSRGIHIYVPLVRGPIQKDVWRRAKAWAQELASQCPGLITAEYRVANRPPGHVLVDYNQNAWGRTLASVYSVRPKPKAPVSTPLEWREVEKCVALGSFRLDNVPQRIARLGDLFQPLVKKTGRVALERFA